MSWSAGFKAALAAGGPQTWRVRTLLVGTEATYAGVYVATSGPPIGDEDPILSGPPAIQGSSLNIDSWSATLGGMTFDLSGDLSTFRQYITRGTFVEVTLAMGGYVEIFAFGRVTGVSYRKGTVQLSIGDALTILDSRPVQNGDEVSLFYDVGSSSALTADYTAGDTTVHVSSVSAFSRETSGTGCIQIGEAFFTYTGTSGGTDFTTVSAAGQFWTDEADVASGEQVYEVALLQGHPLEIALRLLLSTGAGTNTSYDVYPASWGYGIAAAVVAVDDIEAEVAEVMTVDTGTYVISVVVTEQQDSPRTWLLGILAAFGVFPVMREGQLSFRAFSTMVGKQRDTAGTITDADIDQSVGISSEWWNSGQSAEYGLVEIYAQHAPHGDSDESIATFPAVQTKVYDLEAVLYTNTGAVMTDVHDRLYRVAKRIGEVLTLPLSGLGACTVAVGDRMIVKSALTGLRFSYTGLGREVWVTQVQPDPRSGRVTLKAVSLPPEDPF